MGFEIERKFVPAQPPPQLTGARILPIAQGYLAVDDDAEVRVRRIAERHVLTVKRGSGLRRLEEEIDLPAEQFAALWRATEGRRLEKRRHVFEEDGVTFEVDVYDGALTGLLVAEVEFGSEEESAAFAPPAWLGREVTGDRRYSNQQLALAGWPDAAVAPSGRIAHVAINADDDATRVFHAALFGWSFEAWGPPGFSRAHVAAADDKLVVALQERRDLIPGLRLNAPELTIAVDDLAAAEQTVTSYGGTIVMAPTAIPGVGTLLFAQDPSGNVVGIIEYAR